MTTIKENYRSLKATTLPGLPNKKLQVKSYVPYYVIDQVR